jgi:hypothetical protein
MVEKSDVLGKKTEGLDFHQLQKKYRGKRITPKLPSEEDEEVRIKPIGTDDPASLKFITAITICASSHHSQFS